MGLLGKLGGAVGGFVAGNLLLPGIGGLIGAGLGAGMGGGGSKGNKQTSAVQLGSQSSLEQLLGGTETTGFDEEGINSLNSQISRLKQSNPDWSNNRVIKDQINALEKQRKNLQKTLITKRTGGEMESLYGQYKEKIGTGPDLTSYNQAKGAGQDLASLLEEYAKTGGLPQEADVTAAGGLAKNLFSARRTALEQDLADQYTQAQQEFGRRGMMTNDPVAIAKMRTGFMKQRDLMSAEQMAEQTRIAMGIPASKAQYAASRYATLGDIAGEDIALYNQGVANMQNLLGVGSGLLDQERNWRYNVAPKTNTQATLGGGGFMGGLANSLAVGGKAMETFGKLKMGTGFQGLGFLNQTTQPTQSPGLYSGSNQSLGFGVADQFRFTR